MVLSESVGRPGPPWTMQLLKNPKRDVIDVEDIDAVDTSQVATWTCSVCTLCNQLLGISLKGVKADLHCTWQTNCWILRDGAGVSWMPHQNCIMLLLVYLYVFVACPCDLVMSWGQSRLFARLAEVQSHKVTPVTPRLCRQAKSSGHVADARCPAEKLADAVEGLASSCPDIDIKKQKKNKKKKIYTYVEI